MPSGGEEAARLTDIMAAQIATLEAALREADSRRRRAEAQPGPPRFPDTATAAGLAVVPAAGGEAIERDRRTVLRHASQMLLGGSAARSLPPGVAAACDRLAPDDPARTHHARVRGFLDPE